MVDVIPTERTVIKAVITVADLDRVVPHHIPTSPTSPSTSHRKDYHQTQHGQHSRRQWWCNGHG